MNNFVINITLNSTDIAPSERETAVYADRALSEELPKITIYRMTSGEYFSRETDTLLKAIAQIVGSQIKSTPVSIAVEMRSISQRTRRIK